MRFFVWEACWGKVSTLDQFQRRGWSLVNGCAVCKEELEPIDHILLPCAKAKVLWLLVFSLCGIQWVISGSVRNTLLGWLGYPMGRRHRKAWRAAPFMYFFGVIGRKKIEEYLTIRRC